MHFVEEEELPKSMGIDGDAKAWVASLKQRAELANDVDITHFRPLDSDGNRSPMTSGASGDETSGAEDEKTPLKYTGYDKESKTFVQPEGKPTWYVPNDGTATKAEFKEGGCFSSGKGNTDEDEKDTGPITAEEAKRRVADAAARKRFKETGLLDPLPEPLPPRRLDPLGISALPRDQ